MPEPSALGDHDLRHAVVCIIFLFFLEKLAQENKHCFISRNHQCITEDKHPMRIEHMKLSIEIYIYIWVYD
jgi:hypothetical protein